MQNLAEICKVEGIDAVFIGPSDLAASMGLLGQPRHERVKKEVCKGLQVIQASGLVAGTLALQEDLVIQYREAGASFIGTAVDLVLLAKATQGIAERYR
jgi:4-hydroxy-2-oxoheptanedioate aldolase